MKINTINKKYMKNEIFVCISRIVPSIFIAITACVNQSTELNMSGAKDEFEIPKDSAQWDFQLFEKYYSKSLIKLLKDSIISYHEAQIIDREHINLWFKDSCKAKKYVFILGEAIRTGQTPIPPHEFLPLNHANDTLH